MEKPSTWRKKRTIAHNILSKLVTDSLKDKNGKALAGIDVYGEVFKFEGKPKAKEIEYPKKNLNVIIDSLDYSKENIDSALALLLVKGHIQIDITEKNESLVYATLQGRFAYEDLYYVNQRKEHWHRDILNTSNWLTPIMTLIVAILALLVSINQCKAEANKTNDKTMTTATNKK